MGLRHMILCDKPSILKLKRPTLIAVSESNQNELYSMPHFTSFVVKSLITKALSFRKLYDIT